MRYTFFSLILVLGLLLHCNAFGQSNINREVSNTYENYVDRMEDSLRVVSDSLYGIGINCFKVGKLDDALTFFRKANVADSLSYHLDYNNDLFCSSKAWMIYILYSQNRKDEASNIAGDCFSYFNGLARSNSLTAEYLYRIKPFDRRPFELKMDSLHKELDKKDIPYTLDWTRSEGSYEGFVEEEKIVRKMFGPNHYLNAEYLEGLGNVCRNPYTALSYYCKAKKIYDYYSTQSYMDSAGWMEYGMGNNISKVESEIHADSLFEEGIKLYKSGNYIEADSLFSQCTDFYKNKCKFYCSPGQRAIGGLSGDRRMIYKITKGDLPDVWRAGCYTKMGDMDKAKKVSYFYDFAPLEWKRVAPLDSLFQKAEDLFGSNDAITYYRQFVNLLANRIGTDNCWYAFVKLQEGRAYEKLYKIDSAIKCYEDAQAIFEKTVGKYNRWNNTCFKDLQHTYQLLGKSRQALVYSKELLNNYLQMFGKHSVEYLYQLAVVALQYSRAEQNEQACQKAEETLGLLNGMTVKLDETTLYNIYDALYACFHGLRQYEKSLDILKKMEPIVRGEKIHAFVLAYMASAYCSLYDFRNARIYCDQAYKENVLSRGLFSYYYLWNIYFQLNEKDTALKVLYEAKNKFREYDQDIRNQVNVLSALGDTFYSEGDYVSALKYYEDALSLAIKHNDKFDSKQNFIIGSISKVYRDMGYFDKSLTYAERCIDGYRMTDGIRSGNYSLALALKADILQKMEDKDSSMSVRMLSLEILRKIYGFSDICISEGYIPLIRSYIENKQYKKAGKTCDYVLNKIKGTTNSSIKWNIAKLYEQKSYIYYKIGKLSKAIDIINNSLRIYDSICGEENASYINCEELLVNYLLSSGDTSEASKRASHVASFKMNYIDSHFSDLTTNERNLLWNKNKNWFDKEIPMFADKNVDSKPLAKLAYNNILYSKGILLSTEQHMSSLIEEKGDEIAKNTYNELRNYRLQLNKLYESSKKSQSNSVAELENKVTDLEKELSLQLKEYIPVQDQRIEWQDVANKLKEKEAAVEFVSYQVADSIIYDAYLLKKDYTSPKIIRLIKIGATTSLNKPDVYYSTELSNHIWGKMSTELKDVKSIYFAPASDLYSIAIEALPLWDDSTKYVCDRWNFYRLSSTRQLVLAKPHRKYTKAAVYGGLTYKLSNNEEAADTVNAGNTDKTTTETTLYTTFDVKSLNTRGGISELPATYTEAINIDKMLSAAKVPDKLETKKAGTEESFKGMSGKGFDLLHIATHGFYWSESNASKLKRLSFLQENSSSENRSAEDKTLTRSGLLLTGAANSILGIGLPKGAEDGVLTAGEVSQLNLSGLDLVVMSACQTGLGELSGDGVFGLQRGFKKAGANALLMTLCKVDDNATSLLMSRFYKNLLEKGMSKHKAFVDAQKYVRDYTFTKTINVEGDISESDMKLMEQYGGELPEPEDGKITITLHPYKDPRFWSVFILEDGLDGNNDTISVFNSRQTRDKKLNEIEINNKPTSDQGYFDRWSGKYKAIWGFPRKYDYDLDGVEGDFEIYKDSTGHYKGRVQLINGPIDLDGTTNLGESLIGNIIVKNNGSSLVVYLDEFKLNQGDGVESPEKNVYRVNNVKPKDEAFVFEYKGKGQYIIKPIGKLANIIKYNEYRIVKKDKNDKD